MIKSKKLVCEITPQLAEFLNEPGRKKISRTEVTRRIDTYIQKNHLQDIMNPANIYPDIKLMTLLLSAFSPNPRPYPKMITFEMLRDIISNHCLFTRYEDYYYNVPGHKSKVSINHSVCHHCHIRHQKKHKNHHDDLNNYNDDDAFIFILCIFIIIVIITTIISTLYKIF